MKYFMIVAFTLISFASSPTWGETMNDLVTRGGVYYKKFSEVPFTGEIEGERNDSTSVIGIEQGSFVMGLREGFWITYWDNGQLLEKGSYKGGLKEGAWINYDYYGNLDNETNYKNGAKEGYSVTYWDDGQILEKGYFKNDLRDGYWESYNSDGSISDLMGHWKDGQRISMSTAVDSIYSLDPARYDAAKVIDFINASTLDDATKTSFISAVVMAGTDPAKQGDVIAQIRKALKK